MAKRQAFTRKSGNRNDVQTSGRLMLALNEAAAASTGANPTPQQTMDAVGKTLHLAAGGIFLMRGSDITPIALHFRTQSLRDAFVVAYGEKTVGIHTAQQMEPIGQAINLADWNPLNPFPPYILKLLSVDAWVMALNLTQEDEVIGLLWMVGSPQPANGPPSEDVAHTIAQLALHAVQSTVGRAWAVRDSEELQLLEELGGILTQERALQNRLDIVVERTQRTTGFASVTLSVGDFANGRGPAAFAHALDEANYSDEYYTWAAAYYTSDEYRSQPSPYSDGRKGTLLFPDPAKISDTAEPNRRWLIANEITFVAFIPLIYGDEHLGTFRIYSSFNEEQTWERLRVFTALATHIAAILKSAMLFDQVQEAHTSLTASHYATVRTLAYAAEARDPYTGDHLKHIEAYVRVLAPNLGLSPIETEEISLGAILHDVGKLHVPDAILLKPGKLDAKEWEIIRRHPLSGEEILIHSNIPHAALKIVRWHHERLDGNGYPDGLRGDDIPLAAQIITVADVFDALTSARPYKTAWPADRALAEILKHSGSQFAPHVVDAFRALCDEGLITSILSNHTETTPTAMAKSAAA